MTATVRRARAVLGAAVLALAAACGSSPMTSPEHRAAAPCPQPTLPTSNAVQITRVDSLRWHGALYVANLRGQQKVSADKVGPVVASVDCSASGLTAAYLAKGEPVHALKGWPVSCRLVAERERAHQVYELVNAGTSRLAACQPLRQTPAK